MDAWYDPDPEAPWRMHVREGSFLDDAERFDADFFGLSPREAASMDPQQRLLLEVSCEALENAGIPLESLEGSSTGVFVGVCSNDYAWLQLDEPDRMDPPYFGTGSSHNILAGRLSYLLNLRGPAMALDTACSSSLVATHLACQSLRNKECDIAMAGGVNLILSPLTFILPCKMGLMSPDARSYTFDRRAAGMSRGEGCGVVVLKRLEDAVSNKDRILAVIRGSAVNQDGRTNGMTAPNRLSQERLIQAALDDAGIPPERIGHVETHGTATPLGDPAEVEALKAALGASAEHMCALGAVKANIGHLEAAAGIAGLIKTILALRRATIPPHPLFEELSPAISFADSPLFIPTTPVEWKAFGDRRAGGVSSFGWSGTNAHIILEEAPAEDIETDFQKPPIFILPLSARHPKALKQRVCDFRSRLEEDQHSLPDLFHTAGTRMSHHSHRLCVVGQDKRQIQEALQAFEEDELRPGVSGGKVQAGEPGLVFLYPGQGSQWPGMGRELYASEGAFRDSLDECDRVIAEVTGRSVIESMFAPAGDSRLESVDTIQPCIFAIQIALSRLWESYGIRPDAVAGHSLGEVAAACAAGALDISDGGRIMAERSRLVKQVSGAGAMAFVELGAKEASDLLETRGLAENIAVAAHNSPDATLLSGDAETMDSLLSSLEKESIFCRRVNVDYASHSPQMDPLQDELLKVLDFVSPRKGTIPLYSTVTGAIEDGSALDARYWVRNLRDPVLFHEVFEKLKTDGYSIFVEISPHTVLLSTLRARPDASLAALSSMKRDEPEREHFFTSLGALHVAGYPVDFRQFSAPTARFSPPPAYPWLKERHGLARTKNASSLSSRSRRVLPSPESTGNDSSDVAVFYDSLTPDGAAHEYLSWAPFPEIVPGFSWIRCVFFPEQHPEHLQILKEAQKTMRNILFDGVDLSQSGRVLDFGCGVATDLLELAEEYEHLRLDGYTISPVQAKIGMKKAADKGLKERLRILCRDSTRHDFPDMYDIIYGIEVAGLIEDKQALFRNISAHLAPGGMLLIADFIANTASPIDAQHTSTYSSTRDEWAALLADHSLRALDCVDVSEEVANCLFDEDYESHFQQALEKKNNDELIRKNFSSYPNVRGALRKKIISYSLLKAQKDPLATPQDLLRFNRRILGASRTYSEALRDSRKSPKELHEIHWEPADFPQPIGGPENWLILTDNEGLGDALKERMEKQGRNCRLSAFLEPEQLEGLLAETFQDAAAGCGIAFVQSAPSERPLHEDSLSVLHLVQALMRVGFRDTPRLWLVSLAATPVSGNTVSAQAPPAGLATTVAHEYPEFRCANVDLPSPPSNTDLDGLVRLLRSETDEDRLALRRNILYAARLRPLKPKQGDASRTAIRPDASYLVTGGLSGLGFALALWLARQGAGRLVLAGRGGASREVRAELDRIENSKVEVAKVDVSDKQALSELIDRIDPPLRGVFHSAVVIEDATLMRQNPEGFSKVFAAKAEGARNLHELTKDMDLDHFVLFSSLASVLGSPGQGNYAAANAYVDALAHERAQAGLPSLTVNWPPVSETGLATLDSKRGERLAGRGLLSFSPEEVLQILGHLLANPSPARAIVMRLNMRQWRQYYPRVARTPFFSLLGEGGDPSGSEGVSVRKDLEQTEATSRLPFLERHISEQLALVLKKSKSDIESRTPLKNYGFDSLMAVELRNRLEVSLELPLSATLVWSHPTVGSLASFLLKSAGFGEVAEKSASAEDERLAEDLLAELEASEGGSP